VEKDRHKKRQFTATGQQFFPNESTVKQPR
jgi:hypothetical protein